MAAPLTGPAAQARAHVGIAIPGVVLMVPGIAMAVSGGTPALAAAGAVLALTSMGIFLVTVLRHGFGARMG